MMSERERKQKWSLNPRGKNWSNNSNKFGQKLLEKMGWSAGKGLGANEDGMTEHIRVSYKNDTQGMGFKTKDDQWTEHESNFTELLNKLTANNSNEVENESKLSSLEKKSLFSKTRVHYHKFTRGEDLSRYSEKDLANIFGKKSLKDFSKPKTVKEGKKGKIRSSMSFVKDSDQSNNLEAVENIEDNMRMKRKRKKKRDNENKEEKDTKKIKLESGALIVDTKPTFVSFTKERENIEIEGDGINSSTKKKKNKKDRNKRKKEEDEILDENSNEKEDVSNEMLRKEKKNKKGEENEEHVKKNRNLEMVNPGHDQIIRQSEELPIIEDGCLMLNIVCTPIKKKDKMENEVKKQVMVGEVGDPDGENEILSTGEVKLKYKYAKFGKMPSWMRKDNKMTPKSSYRHLIKGDIILTFKNTNLHNIKGYNEHSKATTS